MVILQVFSSLDDAVMLCFSSRPENKMSAAVLTLLGMAGNRHCVRCCGPTHAAVVLQS